MTALDPYPLAPPAERTGPCVCGGAGWVPVDQEYVDRHILNHLDEHQQPIPGARQALADSVMPCYDCRPEQYRLWAEGHYLPGHRPCAACRPRRKQTGGRRG